MMGRELKAPIGADEFLVAGIGARVDFLLTPPANSQQTQLLDVAQGHYDGTLWKFERFWNGDETDHGLNFHSPGAILHVKLGTYWVSGWFNQGRRTLANGHGFNRLMSQDCACAFAAKAGAEFPRWKSAVLGGSCSD